MKLKESLRRFRARQNNPYQYSDEELEECRCANCGHVFRGNYCPVCRQEVGDGRITWKWVGKSILDIWEWTPAHFPTRYCSSFGDPAT